MGDTQHDTGIAAGLNHFTRMSRFHCKRFFTQDVLACACCGQHRLVVHRIRQRDVDRIDISVCDQTFQILVNVSDIEFFGECTALLRRAAETGDQFRAGAVDDARRHEIRGDPAQTDDAPA